MEFIFWKQEISKLTSLKNYIYFKIVYLVINKNVHVPKMQHNTTKTFLKNILSFCTLVFFVLLSFCPFDLFYFCLFLLLSFFPFIILSFCSFVLLFFCPVVLLSKCPFFFCPFVLLSFYSFVLLFFCTFVLMSTI